VAAIDKGAVREALTGRSLGEGMAALSQLPGVAATEVSHEPHDTGNFPRLGFRIDVQVTSPQAAPPG
jgi:hypothetical protein